VACRDLGSRQAVLHLAASLRQAGLVDTAELLEGAYDREARIVALDIPDREAILRVLEECHEELLELRATLLQEHLAAARRSLATRHARSRRE
jgi:DNA-binding transcriptional ArsR family regulator